MLMQTETLIYNKEGSEPPRYSLDTKLEIDHLTPMALNNML